jgi:hypothetical protein
MVWGSDAAATMSSRKPPLLFVLNDPKGNQVDAKAIASHVSARYKPWTKTNRKALALDATTKAILTSKQPPNDGKATTSKGDAGPALLSTSLLAAAGSTTSASPSPIDAMPFTHVQKGCVTPISDAKYGTLSQQHPRFRTESKQETSEEAVLGLNGAFQRRPTSVNGRCNLDHLASITSFQAIPPGSPYLDTLTPSDAGFNDEVKSSLYFYLKVIRPFALHLMHGWEWPDSLPLIQASPALTYAIAAYVSLFLSGCLKGVLGMVLPPPANADESPLWPIPPWFHMHTTCLAELNPLLADPQMVDEASFLAILFLFRIAVLLADGKTARMHYQALRRIPALVGRKDISIENELAVAKVSIIDAFLHHSSV